MVLRLRVNYSPAAWAKTMTKSQGAVSEAAVAALREVAALSVQEGRLNIAASGRRFAMNEKWVQGLQYRTKDATKGGEASLQAKAIIFHRFGIAGVFEHGATIEGKPLMWIPTSPDLPRIRKSGKKLVFATIRGQPVAFDAADRARDRKPLYVGIKSAQIAKRWHITEIVKANVKKFSALFVKHFKVG